jgi:hypothetical protein
MFGQSTVRKGLAAFLIALPLSAGCGDETQETGPAFEPNRGPEIPAGAGKGIPKGGEKGAAKSKDSADAKTEKSEPNKK